MSVKKLTINYKLDGAVELHNAMVGSVVSEITVDGTPISENANFDTEFRNIVIIMDNGVEICFKSEKVDGRDVAGVSQGHGSYSMLTADLLDMERAIGKRVIAAWMDGTTTAFLDGEVGFSKTFRIFVEDIHLPLELFSTVSILIDDFGPAIYAKIRQEEK